MRVSSIILSALRFSGFETLYLGIRHCACILIHLYCIYPLSNVIITKKEGKKKKKESASLLCS